jgi:hypothetical protein
MRPDMDPPLNLQKLGKVILVMASTWIASTENRAHPKYTMFLLLKISY